MKSKKIIRIPVLLLMLAGLMTLPFQSCNPDDCDDDGGDVCDTCAVVYKPNIYIYPEETTQLSVSLDFPLGGEVLISIPSYNNGWNITVDKNGLIDNEYTYLFYESTQPDVWQQDEGWLIEKLNLEEFFNENMANYGFSDQEIKDFIAYWIPKLTGFDHYAICPQNSDIINQVIELSISKEPDQILRLFYTIEGIKEPANIELMEPEIDTSFERNGFFVTEWGVVLK